MRQNFWDLIAEENPRKDNGMDLFTQNDMFTKKTIQEIADHLGTGVSGVVALKNGTRGASVPVAKKAAFGTSLKSGNVYLSSQLRALENKITKKQIQPENILSACLPIMKAIHGSFRSDEISRDASFVAAAERLKEIAEAALETYGAGEGMGPAAGSGNDQGPTYSTGDSVAPALKSTRDAHGRKIPEGDEIERDGYGRVLK